MRAILRKKLFSKLLAKSFDVINWTFRVIVNLVAHWATIVDDETHVFVLTRITLPMLSIHLDSDDSLDVFFFRLVLNCAFNLGV